MLRTIIILLFLSACVPRPLPEVVPLPEYRAREITVLVVDASRSRYGAGVLVAPNKVLTANHVVLSDQVGVSFYKTRSTFIIGKIVWRSKNVDLALLSIPPVVVSPAVISCELPELGTPVFIIGQSAYRVGWTSRYGKVASSDVDPDGSVIVYMFATSGDSGAGVFNYDGKLVGILETIQISGSSGNAGLSFIIPGSKICSELAGRL